MERENLQTHMRIETNGLFQFPNEELERALSYIKTERFLTKEERVSIQTYAMLQHMLRSDNWMDYLQTPLSDDTWAKINDLLSNNFCLFIAAATNDKISYERIFPSLDVHVQYAEKNPNCVDTAECFIPLLYRKNLPPDMLKDVVKKIASSKNGHKLVNEMLRDRECPEMPQSSIIALIENDCANNNHILKDNLMNAEETTFCRAYTKVKVLTAPIAESLNVWGIHPQIITNILSNNSIPHSVKEGLESKLEIIDNVEGLGKKTIDFLWNTTIKKISDMHDKCLKMDIFEFDKAVRAELKWFFMCLETEHIKDNHLWKLKQLIDDVQISNETLNSRIIRKAKDPELLEEFYRGKYRFVLYELYKNPYLPEHLKREIAQNQVDCVCKQTDAPYTTVLNDVIRQYRLQKEEYRLLVDNSPYQTENVIATSPMLTQENLDYICNREEYNGKDILIIGTVNLALQEKAPYLLPLLDKIINAYEESNYDTEVQLYDNKNTVAYGILQEHFGVLPEDIETIDIDEIASLDYELFQSPTSPLATILQEIEEVQNENNPIWANHPQNMIETCRSTLWTATLYKELHPYIMGNPLFQYEKRQTFSFLGVSESDIKKEIIKNPESFTNGVPENMLRIINENLNGFFDYVSPYGFLRENQNVGNSIEWLKALEILRAKTCLLSATIKEAERRGINLSENTREEMFLGGNDEFDDILPF